MMITNQDKKALVELVKTYKLVNCIMVETRPSLEPDSNVLIYDFSVSNISEAQVLAKQLKVALIQVKNISAVLPDLWDVVNENNLYLINEKTNDGNQIKLYWESE